MLHQVLEFYNYATSVLLDRLSKEIKLSNGTKTWRPLVAYKNLVRAIENSGIAAAYTLRYFSTGRLNQEEVLAFLQAQVSLVHTLETFQCPLNLWFIKKRFYLRSTSIRHPIFHQKLKDVSAELSRVTTTVVLKMGK